MEQAVIDSDAEQEIINSQRQDTQGGRMIVRLTYVIKYVADIERAVKFYKEQLGVSLRFQSPEWSEFETGETETIPNSVESPVAVGVIA